MLSHVLCGAVLGIDAYLVRVEADIASGLPSFATVGLPRGAVRESEKRVTAAIKNSGYEIPPKKITINLSPADIRKEGSAFDLPIAVGILAGTGQLSERRLGGYVLLGELGLDGSLRPVRGALPVAVAVRRRGLRGLVVPRENVGEASVVAGVEVLAARTLREVAEFLDGGRTLVRGRASRRSEEAARTSGADYRDVRGQEAAKRALEIAAAGAHNILMIGPPGSGKTMLARRLPGILPPLTPEEAIETTKIHSVAGLLAGRGALLHNRPFRAPHHTISDAGLVGGGSSPRPGEVSLAHHGVLFLDELPEFKRQVLEVLRQPLEEGEVSIGRAGLTLTYPARVMLAAAMNPCPCGWLGEAGRSCSCPPQLVQRYLSRLSGPLMDRIDLHIEVPAVPPTALASGAVAEASDVIRERVIRARERQRRRLRGRPGAHANAHLRPNEVREHCRPDARGEALLRAAVTRLGLSARAYHRVLRIARTIADLDGSEGIAAAHLAEAIQYRSLDRRAPEVAGAPRG